MQEASGGTLFTTIQGHQAQGHTTPRHTPTIPPLTISPTQESGNFMICTRYNYDSAWHPCETIYIYVAADTSLPAERGMSPALLHCPLLSTV